VKIDRFKEKVKIDIDCFWQDFKDKIRNDGLCPHCGNELEMNHYDDGCAFEWDCDNCNIKFYELIV